VPVRRAIDQPLADRSAAANSHDHGACEGPIVTQNTRNRPFSSQTSGWMTGAATLQESVVVLLCRCYGESGEGMAPSTLFKRLPKELPHVATTLSF
jgi:hypothetical protein